MSDELDEAGDGGAAGDAGRDEAAEGLVTEARKPLNQTTVTLFVLVVVGAAGVYLMRGRAAGGAALAPGKQSAALAQFIQDNAKNRRALEDILRNTQVFVDQFKSFPQVPLSELKTNPFRLVEPQAEDLDAAARKRAERERQEIVKAVQGLHLQSIVYGDARRACMINNALCAEGQQVGEFTVERITANSVVVKSGVYRFELRMQR